jgi:hypothetical protein
VGASPAQDDAIFAARTFSKGNKFTRPHLLTSIQPFEQDQEFLRFRTEAFPTIASSVDAAGAQSWTHVAWAQRAPNGDSQIVVSLVPVKPPPPSNDEDDDPCDGWKIPAVPLDASPITDGATPGHQFSRGHQFMPQLTFSQGRLVAIYYDSRLDHTRTYFTPNDPCLRLGLPSCWQPDAQGRWYTEERGPLGERGPLDLAWAPTEIDDTGLNKTRHTIDVRMAVATPAAQPVFTSATLSRMPFGERGDESSPDPRDPSRDSGDAAFRPFAFGAGNHIDLIAPGSPPTLLRLQDLQVNAPNLPMFKNGTRSFIGDYIDVQGPMFVRTSAGWAFNTQYTAAPVFHAVWTSNQDVVPPADGNWANYTPVGTRSSSAPSLVDGTPVPVCTVGQAGSRNQNVYTARITEGLFVTSPQNAKTLSPTFLRNFVVSAFNATGVDRTFAFTLPNPLPTGLFASFSGDGSTQDDKVTVTIPAHSTASQTVFMRLAGGGNPATLVVTVTEVGVAVPLAGAVTLNPPGLTFDLGQPDGATAPIGSGEVLTVQISAAHLSNANLSNAHLSNANLSNANLSNANLSNANLSNANLSNTTIDAAHLSNANLSNANLSNANLSNANLSNANLSNANLSNANLSNAALTDIDYTVTNTGNTSQAFDVRLLATAATSGPIQLIVSKTYTKPVANGCDLQEQPDNKTVVNAGIVNPASPDALAGQNPLATFALAPGETIQVTLRTLLTIEQARVLATTVAPVVSPQGAPGTLVPALLVQTPAILPAGAVGTAYQVYQPIAPVQLTATGVIGTAAWTCVPADCSTLPTGLSLSSTDGILGGTPVAAGTFHFTVQLTDTVVVPGQPTQTKITQKDMTLVIQTSPTTASLTPSNAAPVYGETVTLTASVSPASGPTGSIAFSEVTSGGTASLGSVALTSGAAVLTLPAAGLSIGVHAYKASYAGDGNWDPSTSTTSVTVGPAPTSATLTSGGATSYGDQATFTATVQAPSPGSGTPTGQVEFREGTAALSSLLGTSTLSTGIATLKPSTLTGGSHTVFAAYLGDGNYAPSQTTAVVQSVSKVTDSLGVTVTALSFVFGVPVSILATVGPIPGGAQPPGGTVYFWDSPLGLPSIQLGSAPLSGGGATLLGVMLGAGDHALGASYDGDGNYGAVPLTNAQAATSIGRAAVAVDVTSSPNPSVYGAPVAIKAHVTSTAGIPAGNVTFYRDVNVSLGTVALDGTGFAVLSSSVVPGGTRAISAYYEGSANFGAMGTSISVNQQVNAASATATLASATPSSTFGQAITLTCAVSSTVGTPTGSVTIWDLSTNPASALSTVTLAGGVASYLTAALPVGSHSLACQYAGDGNFAGATSAALTQTVISIATTTTVTASANPVLDDKPVTFTATVTGTGGTPTGTVTFLDGAKTLGTATLSLGKASLVLKSLNEGLHGITAVYGGSATFAGSTSAVLSLKVLEDYSCKAYQKPLVTGGTVTAPSKSGSFTFGTRVGVRWQFVKPTGVFVTRNTAVKGLAAVFDSGCTGKPATGAPRIPLYDPVAGPATGSTFTYDTAANQYYLNWDTSKASRGCWDIVLTADNGVPQVATIVTLR